MKILLLGMNHKSAPLDVRERFAIDDPTPMLQKLVACDEIDEAVVVSTCNRVELYAVANGDGGIAIVDCTTPSSLVHTDSYIVDGCYGIQYYEDQDYALATWRTNQKLANIKMLDQAQRS